MKKFAQLFVTLLTVPFFAFFVNMITAAMVFTIKGREWALEFYGGNSTYDQFLMINGLLAILVLAYYWRK